MKFISFQYANLSEAIGPYSYPNENNTMGHPILCLCNYKEGTIFGFNESYVFNSDIIRSKSLKLLKGLFKIYLTIIISEGWSVWWPVPVINSEKFVLLVLRTSPSNKRKPGFQPDPSQCLAVINIENFPCSQIWKFVSFVVDYPFS